MTAKLTKGITWVTGSTVNSANLDAHIASASLAGVARENVDATDGFVMTVAAQPPPSQAALEPWCHEDVYWPMSLVGTDQKTLRAGAETVQQKGGGTTLTAGSLVEVVRVTGGVLVVGRATAGWKVYGVAAMDIAPGANGVIVTTGVTRCLAASAVSPGDKLTLSSTDGEAETDSVGVGPGVFGVALSARLGGFAWVALQR